MNRAVLSGDERFAVALLPAVSRTFAVSIELLPEGLREAVRVGYLLCRIVDTIEDEPDLDAAARVRMFDAFDLVVEHDDVAYAPFERLGMLLAHASEAEAELARHAGAVFRLFRALPLAAREAIRPHVLEMSAGMREYAARADRDGGLQIEDLADLERYAWFVAGTVGHLLTALFLDHVGDLDPAARATLRSHATSFGLGLQLVNIVKDVAEDHVRGICFLPAAELRAAGLDRPGLLDPGRREAGLSVVRAVAARARAHLVRAEAYTRAWPVPQGEAVRRFCALPLALAHATLSEVEHGADTLVPGRTPKVPREVVASLLMKSADAALGDTALDALLADAASWRPGTPS